MKIIISPAKSQQNTIALNHIFHHPTFHKKTQILLEVLQALTIEELGAALTLKGKLLKASYDLFQNYDAQKSTQAIKLYTGLVFKGLENLNYSPQELMYLDQHLRILSAFYGMLHPFDAVKPYRLDMKAKLIDGGLYKFWASELDAVFEGETIINLASAEFSKLIKRPMINIIFKEERQPDQFKVVATHAKQARGEMLCWMIQNDITTIEAIKSFSQSGYRYKGDLSTKNNLVFTRTENFSLKNSDERDMIDKLKSERT